MSIRPIDHIVRHQILLAPLDNKNFTPLKI